MIKYFRKFRQNLLAENRVNRYLLYAVGEIVLVVIGILIALQINNWNERNENKKLEVFYLNSLKSDLIKDTIDINHTTEIQIADQKTTSSYLERILHPRATIDTIVKIAREEIDYKFHVKRDYANNTFNTIISSGNIELFDKELIEKLMVLNNLQLDQLKRFENHVEFYQNVMFNYAKRFPIYSEVPEGNIVETLLWKDLDEKELIGHLIAALEIRKFMFRSTVSGHLRVKEKSSEILQLIDVLLENN